MSNTSFTTIRRVCNSVTAMLLCILLAGGMAPGSVRADVAPRAYLPGHAYVHYTANHLLASSGEVEELCSATNENDGHVYDLYGNRVIFNADNTISNGSKIVVGFVCSSVPAAW